LLARAKHAFGQAGLYPLPDADTFNGSVADLHHQLLDAQRAFVGRSTRYQPFCSNGCDPMEATLDKVEEILCQEYHVSHIDWEHGAESRQALLRLTESEKARLKRQREKSGLIMDRGWP
jgi:hypothetical protein